MRCGEALEQRKDLIYCSTGRSDVIDGINVENGTSFQALDVVSTEFDKSNVEVVVMFLVITN